MKRALLLMGLSMWLWLPDEGEASCAYGGLGSDQAITKSDITEYKASVCSYFDGPYGGCALAVSRGGAWGTGCGSTDSHATNSAIGECQRHAQQHESCTLVARQKSANASPMIERGNRFIALQTGNPRHHHQPYESCRIAESG